MLRRTPVASLIMSQKSQTRTSASAYTRMTERNLAAILVDDDF